MIFVLDDIKLVRVVCLGGEGARRRVIPNSLECHTGKGRLIFLTRTTLLFLCWRWRRRNVGSWGVRMINKRTGRRESLDWTGSRGLYVVGGRWRAKGMCRWAFLAIRTGGAHLVRAGVKGEF